VIARFEDYTGLFAYHCHILEHEDHAMMRQFRVTCLKGDANFDGQLDGRDVGAFTAELIAPEPVESAAFCAADMDDDGLLETDEDVASFVECLVNGVCP
jgi:hypothetical protein